MTPAQIADVIATIGADVCYITVKPENGQPHAITISRLNETGSLDLTLKKPEDPQPLDGPKDKAAQALGGKSIGSKIGLDPFTKQKKTLGGSWVIPATSPSHAAELCALMFTQILDYPAQTVLIAEATKA